MNPEHALIIRGAALETCLGSDPVEVAERIQSKSSILQTIPPHLTLKPSTIEGSPFSRSQLSCLQACEMVIEKALNEAELDHTQLKRCALIVGTISGESHLLEETYLNEARKDLTNIPEQISGRGPGKLSSTLKEKYGFGGPCFSLNTACTSSANAIYHASLLLINQEVDHVVVVGVDVFNAMTLCGFNALMLLDPKGCRPYDAERQGIQIGEGAAALVLELKKGRAGLFNAELLAPCCYNTTHHPTAMDSEGFAAQRIIQKNLQRHDVDPFDIVAIKGHGTGSTEGDRGEVEGMRKTFGENFPPMTSLKGYLGHTMGAVGCVELITYLSCLESGFFPACHGHQNVDPELHFNPPKDHLPAPPGLHLLNFFGFGSTMVSLLIRWKP